MTLFFFYSCLIFGAIHAASHFHHVVEGLREGKIRVLNLVCMVGNTVIMCGGFTGVGGHL